MSVARPSRHGAWRAGFSFAGALVALLVLARPAGACSRVPGYLQGSVVTLLCQEDLPAAWTAVNLSDDWAPRIFSESPQQPQPYRARFVALANEQLGSGPGWSSARRDAHFELFGIFPSFAVIRSRMADGERHACHAGVDDAPLRAWRTGAAAGVRQAPLRGAALAAVRAHLACERLLPHAPGPASSEAATREALAAYQRRHMLPSLPGLDQETSDALLTPSLELDFRTLLRALRERVVDASGLIEDGSARNDWQPVLGRSIESAEYQALRSQPLPGAAPDLITAATEAAATALGWTSPERARAALLAEPPRQAAVLLPPLPAYHSPRMSLRAEIASVELSVAGRALGLGRRPALTLFAMTPEGDVPLVRWPTTVGGWKREKLPGGKEVRRFKASPRGRFFWRDVLAAPTWFPPASTPDHELLRPAPGGGWRVDRDALGPGYRSAYGLLALLQHRSDTASDGTVRLIDTKVRTHGSGNYRSVLRGTSHGCHRLFNHLALRLGGYLLAHTETVRRGQVEERYTRVLHQGGQRLELHARGRGYRFELLQPVPVDVFEVEAPHPPPEPVPAAAAEAEARREPTGDEPSRSDLDAADPDRSC